MSLVTPFLVFFLCIVIEFGWSFYAMAMLNNSSRMGARVGSVHTSNAAIADAIKLARGYVRVASAAVTVTTSAGAVVDSATITFNPAGGYTITGANGAAAPTGDRPVGDYLQVEVMTPYQSFTGLVDLQKLAGITDYRDRSTFLIKY